MFPLSTTAMRIFVGLLVQALLFHTASAVNFSTYLECVTNISSNTANISVPKLAETFSLRMEAKGTNTIMEWEFYDLEFYYDKETQRAAIYYLMKNRRIDAFYDLQNKTVTIITDEQKGRVCKSNQYESSVCSPFIYFLLELAGHSNISEECGMDVSPTYHVTRRADIRDIKAQKWEQCIRNKSFNQTYWSTYHFTAPRVASPSTTILKDYIRDAIMPVPIHFVTRMLGEKAKGITFFYDLTHYIPDIKDKSVLLPGVKCPDPTLENEISSVTKPPVQPQTPLSAQQIEPIPKSFAFVDHIVVTNQSSKLEILGKLLLTWDTVSAPDAVLVHPTIIHIEPYTPTLNPLLRKITFIVTGVSTSGSFDEYAFKQKFRDLVRSVSLPIPNVYLVPPAEIIPLDASIIEKARLFKVWFQS